MADPRWTRGPEGDDASGRDEIHSSAHPGDPTPSPSTPDSDEAGATPRPDSSPTAEASASPSSIDWNAPPTAEEKAAEAAPTTFDDLGLSPELKDAVRELGWERPTPVQSATFRLVSDGQDVVVQSQTGTGKTGAFCLPWLAARFQPGPARETGVQLIVLVPTRELAKQVCDQLVGLAKHTTVVPLPVYGGTAMQPQLQALKEGVHAVVGTPGRVLDHIRRRTLDLSRVRMVVLDEADEMLSMGFLEDIHAILEACPTERQTTLFSATVPPDVERIARRYMRNAVPVKLSGDQVAAAEIEHVYYTVSGALRTRDILDVIALEEPTTALVFCNTREETNVVANVLQREGYRAEALSSDLTQRARERVLGWMRSGRLRFLVATDVASRGIDISHISHVINYTFPENAESYIHRTGRTGRAGRPGRAISLIGPQDLGNFYYLKLQYPTISFEERKLPPKEELERQRMENKLDHVSKLFPELVSPEWTLLARNLMRDPRGEQVIAYLLSQAVTRAQSQPQRPDDEEAEMRADLDEDRRREREIEESRRGRDRRDRRRPDRGDRRRDRSDRPRRRDDRRADADEAERFEAGSQEAQPRPEDTEPEVDLAEHTEATSAEGEDAPREDAAETPDGRSRRRRRRRRGRRGHTTETHDGEATESRAPAEGEAPVEAVTASETAALVAESDATEVLGSEAVVISAGDTSPDGAAVTAANEAAGIETTDAGDATEEPRRKRRRRRRRRGRGREDETSAEAAEDDDGETLSSAAEEDGEERTDDLAVADEGGRRKRRRRRGGRRRRRGDGRDDTAAAQPSREGPSEKRFTQDEIVIDIDEQELEFVRGQFGEIDELDDLTLKGRRRGVIESLQDEVELEDLSASDRSDADAEAAPSQEKADEEGDETETGDTESPGAEDAAAEAEAAPGEAVEDEAERRKRKRRRRRKKKKEEVPVPELTAPPHKDFWEVWAAHYSYKDFEDIELPEPAPPPDEPRAPARAASQRANASAALVEEDDAHFMTVRLNCGRKQGKKAADIREILSTHLDLEGRAVRNLTVGDASTRFRISQRHQARLLEHLHGVEVDGLVLEVTIVEAAPAAAGAADGERPSDDEAASDASALEAGTDGEGPTPPAEAPTHATEGAAETSDTPPP